MKKHTYRAKNVNTINWADLKQQLPDKLSRTDFHAVFYAASSLLIPE